MEGLSRQQQRASRMSSNRLSVPAIAAARNSFARCARHCPTSCTPSMSLTMNSLAGMMLIFAPI